MFGKKKKAKTAAAQTAVQETIPLEPVVKETSPADLVAAARNGTSIEDVLATVPEENRQKFLNQALHDAVDCEENAEVPATSLIKAGAEVNAKIFESNGIILAKALYKEQPTAVIKLLYDNGANFEDTLFLMEINKGWAEEVKNKLKAYQKKLEGKPAAEEAPQPVTEEAILKVLEIVQELREQVDDITKDLKDLKAAQPETTQKRPVPAALKSAAPRQ